MEFKVGDKVERIKERHNQMGIGDIDIITEIPQDGSLSLDKFGVGHYSLNFKIVKETRESPNNFNINNMEKRVFNVIIANKKTGKVEKDEKVIAVNNQEALLKAFGINENDLVISIKEIEGTAFKTEEPVKAILVKEEKAK